MANNCGECQLFQGPNKVCAGGTIPSSIKPARSECFKGPASLFSSKVCGGCRLFQGPNEVCAGGTIPSGIKPARSDCYSPIPG